MTSLPTSLATALTAIASQSEDSQVVNVFTELRLYLEHNKDQLDVANAKNIQLEAELNQVNGELNTVSQSLAMALARPASSNPLGEHKPLSFQKSLQTLECMMVPGVRNLRNGGHAFVCGKMRTPPLLQGQPVSVLYCPEW